jgi:hypothetical protein
MKLETLPVEFEHAFAFGERFADRGDPVFALNGKFQQAENEATLGAVARYGKIGADDTQASASRNAMSSQPMCNGMPCHGASGPE